MNVLAPELAELFQAKPATRQWLHELARQSRRKHQELFVVFTTPDRGIGCVAVVGDTTTADGGRLPDDEFASLLMGSVIEEHFRRPLGAGDKVLHAAPPAWIESALWDLGPVKTPPFWRRNPIPLWSFHTNTRPAR